MTHGNQFSVILHKYDNYIVFKNPCVIDWGIKKIILQIFLCSIC